MINEDQMAKIAEQQQKIRHHLLVTYQEYNKRFAAAEGLGADGELDAEYEDLEQQERDLWDELHALYLEPNNG